MKECHCECGEWSGECCYWTGRMSDTCVVEFMPEHLRNSHEAAGNAGIYPHNGAERIRVSLDCCALMLEEDPDWVQLV